MQAKIELTQADINQAIVDYIYNHLNITVSAADVEVQVKSKQNFRSEWETASIRCSFEAKISG